MHGMNDWRGPANGPGQDLFALAQFMGQSSEHQKLVLYRLDRQDGVLEWIVGRLQDGTDVHHELDKELALQKADMAAHAVEIAALKAAQQTKAGSDKPPALEVWIKYAATLLLPLATFWGTGSIDKAVAVLEKVRGATGH